MTGNLVSLLLGVLIDQQSSTFSSFVYLAELVDFFLSCFRFLKLKQPEVKIWEVNETHNSHFAACQIV